MNFVEFLVEVGKRSVRKRKGTGIMGFVGGVFVGCFVESRWGYGDKDR